MVEGVGHPWRRHAPLCALFCVAEMNAVAPVSDKLDPLIRRLASDKGGEVVATARAIGRQLAKAGLTFHDLADRLTAPEPAAEEDALPVFSNYAAAVE